MKEIYPSYSACSSDCPAPRNPADLSEREVGTFADAEIRGRNQRTQTFGGHRASQKIPLEQITPELFQKRVVFNGLDALGQDTKATRLCKRNHPTEKLATLIVLIEEAPVDLYDVTRQPLKVTEI